LKLISDDEELDLFGLNLY